MNINRLCIFTAVFSLMPTLAGALEELPDLQAPVAVGKFAMKSASEGKLPLAMKYFTLYFSLPEKNPKLTVSVFREAMKTAMRSGEKNTAVKWATEIPGARALPPEDAALAAVFAAALDGRDVNVPELLKVPADRREDVLLRVSNLFYLAGDYPKAKRFAGTSLKEPPRYPVAILREAPVGAWAWKDSPLLKTMKKADEFVSYNQKAAEVLVLDVNTVRGDLSKDSEKKCPIVFYLAADIHGLSFYGEMETGETDETAAGIVPGGTLEMYLQPGAGEPYDQWIWRFFPETVSFAQWMSPHKHYRPVKNSFRHEAIVADGKICLYLRIGWDAFYDRLPDENSQWRFGLVPWLRAGNFTWGSGGQVHELNQFGRLEFKGIGRILPEIKRLLVLRSWASYKKSAAPLKTLWQDEFHGDRNFCNEVLVPYLENLDAYGKQVSSGMSGETVEYLFREAVPGWFELPYEVNEMRREYLRRQLLEP